ncbi:MAG: hypothetical protein ACKOXB_01825 [Flavobacteriales bacterium]
MKAQETSNILGTFQFREYLEAQASYALAYRGGKKSPIMHQIFTRYITSNEALLTSKEIREEIITLPLFSN